MNKNKGFIGIGLIIAIVLGVVIVGGGAYYVGKSGEKKEVNNPQVNLPIVEEENQEVEKKVEEKKEDISIVKKENKLVMYNSKTFGYSIGYSGIDTNKVIVVGDGKSINLFPNQSNIDTLEVVDSSYSVPNYLSSNGTVKFGTNEYKKFKNNITSRNIYYLISGLQNNKSIWISVENDSDTPNYLDLASLKINTINSEIITQVQAETLVHKAWSDCTKGDCGGVVVTVTNNNQNFVTAIFTELDDSTSQTKRVAIASYQNGIWTLGQPTITRTCHRGHIDGSLGFTSAFCI